MRAIALQISARQEKLFDVKIRTSLVQKINEIKENAVNIIA